MKNLYFALILIFYSINAFSQAQQIQDLAVQVKAEITIAPPSIHFTWPPDYQATGLSIYRKEKSSTFWGSPIATLAGSDSSWTDNSVQSGESWEYKIFRTGNSYSGFGYIMAGIEVPAIEQKGRVVLVIDSTHSNSLATEIARLEDDLIGEGWLVSQLLVSPTDSVPDVKASIKSIYSSDPSTRTVILLGHVPVPYSGNINPDGHSNHVGAWAADAYYGDMDGLWTDQTVNNISASRVANHNIPGDGKFDQSTIPGDLELEVGRIDMFDMPAFSKTETELLRQYLDKNHAFRHKLFNPERRALVDNHFGYPNYTEGFASNGYRNFGPMFGADNVFAQDYFTSMKAASYLWSYGCGGGSYTSAGGIGNTSNFATDSLQGVFTLLFGSYFGDWDNTNNFLRAPLASGGTILTNAWAGRPFWYFHHMALGENIGYSGRLSQNNSSLYHASFAGRYIHMGLLGDPTLKMHIVAPPDGLIVSDIDNSSKSSLTWNASADSIVGYYVFRKIDSSGYFIRISDQPVSGTSFIDSFPAVGANEYMVAALKLENEASGTYYNLSYGIRGSNVVTGIRIKPAQVNQLALYPNPANEKVIIRLGTPLSKETNIKMFDIRGIEVAHIKIPAGAHRVEKNITEFPSGTYVVVLIAGDYTSTGLFVVQH